MRDWKFHVSLSALVPPSAQVALALKASASLPPSVPRASLAGSGHTHSVQASRGPSQGQLCSPGCCRAERQARPRGPISALCRRHREWEPPEVMGVAVRAWADERGRFWRGDGHGPQSPGGSVLAPSAVQPAAGGRAGPPPRAGRAAAGVGARLWAELMRFPEPACPALNGWKGARAVWRPGAWPKPSDMIHLRERTSGLPARSLSVSQPFP